MKTFLTNAAAGCLTLCIGVSAQGDAFATYTTLDVPGAISTSAFGIDGGNIVGYYSDGSGNRHGFSYDGTAYTTFDVSGASSTHAYGIDGGNIVGYYTDGSGTHGFLAVIPEPATLSLLAVGMLMACRRRRVSCSRVSQA